MQKDRLALDPGRPRARRRAFEHFSLDKATPELTFVEKDRKSEAFRNLRKALGYGWSVVVASHPEIGKVRFEKEPTFRDE